ncbi:hypothetical protein HJC99_01045 [Candidatus Saccharibacteria bacterium]|nr:hypothetical protein [Candidatus Saccharibacteria bacterium]
MQLFAKNKYAIGVLVGVAVLSYGLYLMRYGVQYPSLSFTVLGIIIAGLFAVLAAKQEHNGAAKRASKCLPRWES